MKSENSQKSENTRGLDEDESDVLAMEESRDVNGVGDLNPIPVSSRSKERPAPRPRKAK